MYRIKVSGLCYGDSGGPLLKRIKVKGTHEEKSVIIGINSKFTGKHAYCGGRDSLSHYVRVRDFTGWILRYVGIDRGVRVDQDMSKEQLKFIKNSKDQYHKKFYGWHEYLKNTTLYKLKQKLAKQRNEIQDEKDDEKKAQDDKSHEKKTHADKSHEKKSREKETQEKETQNDKTHDKKSQEDKNHEKETREKETKDDKTHEKESQDDKSHEKKTHDEPMKDHYDLPPPVKDPKLNPNYKNKLQNSETTTIKNKKTSTTYRSSIKQIDLNRKGKFSMYHDDHFYLVGK